MMIQTNRYWLLPRGNSTPSGAARVRIVSSFDVLFRNNGTVGRGGALSCYDSSPTLTNNTIHWNAADDDGGAVYCNAGSNP